MSKVQLINRSDLRKEPKYNTTNEALSPVQVCVLKDDEKDPIQKITKSYFTDVNGNPIEKITKEKEILLVIESENMSGEEIVVNLPDHYGDFKYEGEEITENKVLKMNVGGDSEKIKLEIIPRRRKRHEFSRVLDDEERSEQRERHWNKLKTKHFPDNDWGRTEFDTVGVNYDDFKADYPELYAEMVAKYPNEAIAERYLPELIESGSDIPKKVVFNKGDKVYKIVPKGKDISGPSAYYLSEKQMKKIKEKPDSLEQTLGLPLSSVSGSYDVFEMTAQEDGVSAFESTIAPTEQSGKPPQGSYTTTGGGKQTLIIDNGDTDLWEKSEDPSESITP